MRNNDVRVPAVGFRVWFLHDGALHSPLLPAVWSSAKLNARCLVSGPRPHRAPHAYCVCGVYAFARLRRAVELLEPNYVVGAVLARGDVLIHEDGFRAEQATIVAIGDHPHARHADLVRIADRYGVALCAMSNLALFALARGEYYSKQRAREFGDDPLQ
jgi:hypothetical protein